ncbi:hypothetical protein I3843_13G122300 [Carya illinoinensis]|nr:hypothetical protein I3843_13G122300 [Carya illinoinensis]
MLVVLMAISYVQKAAAVEAPTPSPTSEAFIFNSFAVINYIPFCTLHL